MRVVRLSTRRDQLVVIDKQRKVVRWNKANWSDFSRVQDVFKKLDKKWEKQTIEKTKVFLHALKELDKF